MFSVLVLLALIILISVFSKFTLSMLELSMFFLVSVEPLKFISESVFCCEDKDVDVIEETDDEDDEESGDGETFVLLFDDMFEALFCGTPLSPNLE